LNKIGVNLNHLTILIQMLFLRINNLRTFSLQIPQPKRLKGLAHGTNPPPWTLAIIIVSPPSAHWAKD